ncbi:MAG: FAD-binding oxidoreductase, partial [SAR324 cluster bacterium]|nr:FAD-binding oxidoreductase [SAR324 cluster bacterium]
ESTLRQQSSGESLIERIYGTIWDILSHPENQELIRSHFPKASIKRRNTGYALDALLEMRPFSNNGEPFNLCKLLVGSEGTLAFVTEAVLNLSPLPPPCRGVLCVHCRTIRDSLLANLIVLQHQPLSLELIDRYILECTKANSLFSKHRNFVEGDPEGILLVELAGESINEVREQSKKIEVELKSAGLGFHYPLLFGSDAQSVWAIRKAGLGLLKNIPGDAKATSVIEDAAIAPEDLPSYVEDFDRLLANYKLSSVHYGHIGSGELHFDPILNLKTKEGQKLFRTIAEETAKLVKKYKGSLSGEHGDGRLRGEFIPWMVGEENIELFRRIKQTFDPNLIFNPGKIIDTPPMDHNLRFEVGKGLDPIKTTFHFRKAQGVLRAAELCNGSGDCRKTSKIGGVMCPSYMATLNERDTTRARANVLREFLTNSDKKNKFDHPEILSILDLCVSCKGCASECPSNVDMSKLKAEVLQQSYDIKGIPLQAKLVGHYASLMKIAAMIPKISNWFLRSKFRSYPLRRVLGIATKRMLPTLAHETLRAWFSKREFEGKRIPGSVVKRGEVVLFCDEFTNYIDVEIGKKAIELLEYLGYEIQIPAHAESGRTMISKGLLRKARKVAEENVKALSRFAAEGIPIIGIEPSAILSFRDEYVDLLDDSMLQVAEKVSKKTMTIEEFISEEMQAGRITTDSFIEKKQKVFLHGHCHQKTLSSLEPTIKALSLPSGYEVEVIDSSCCGMAGFFGYEKEHYEISMKMGELRLFPFIRSLPEDAIIAAPGTSCRAQIFDGTGRRALHPAEVLWDALRKY